jgi:hypothetical protein
LALVSVLLLTGHWLDLYVLIMPSFRSGPAIEVMEVLTAAGSAALAYFLCVRQLAKAPLVPLNDPVLIADGYLDDSDESPARRMASGVEP